MTTQESIMSPRLAALQKELEAGNRAALENFWQEVEQQGTPLVESLQGDERNVLVTFRWRAKEETQNIVVIGALGRWNVDKKFAEKQSMTRLLETDLWYKTYTSRADARFTYLLSLNNPQLPLRFYLQVGLLETTPVGETGPSMLVVNRHLRNILQAKGYSFHYAEFNGRHEHLSWQGTLADGLLALIGKEKRRE